MGITRNLSGIFHAGRLCHGGNGFHQSKNSFIISLIIYPVSGHCLCGAAGTIAVGIFDTESGIISGFIYNKELTAAQAFGYFGVQILGVIAVILWVGVLMTAVFLLLSLCRVCGIIQLLNYL